MAKLARSILANAGVESAYHKKLMTIIRPMCRETQHAVLNIYKANIIDVPPIETANDKILVPKHVQEQILRELTRLNRKWAHYFEEHAEELTTWFMTKAKHATFYQFTEALRAQGISVRLALTPRVQEVIRIASGESVNLIKTISSNYFGRIQAAVIDSVEKGRDLAGLEKELTDTYGITDRRARMIAKDQNNKVTQDMAQANARDCGIQKGIWRHHAASKHPRESHILMDGTEYDLEEGCFDSEYGDYIQPAELYSCNCSFRLVIPGLEDNYKQSMYPGTEIDANTGLLKRDGTGKLVERTVTRQNGEQFKSGFGVT